MVSGMYNRNNAAFNFEVVEEQRKAKVIRLPGKNARRLAKIKLQKMLLLGVFSVFCTCAVGISYFILGQAELTELADKSSKAYRNLEQIQGLNTRLSVELKSVNATNSFKDTDSDSVEIVRIHKNDLVKRR